MAVTASIQPGSTVASNGRPGTPGVGQSSRTRPSRTRRWKPSPAQMVIGMSAGRRSHGVVGTICRRSGVTAIGDAGHVGHGRGPRARGVHDRVDRDGAVRGLDPVDPAVGRPPEPGDLRVPLHPHAEPGARP